jgi:hypothetical protein
MIGKTLKIATIGRTEILYDSALLLRQEGVTSPASLRQKRRQSISAPRPTSRRWPKSGVSRLRKTQQLRITCIIGSELDSGDIVAREYLAIDHTTKVTAAWRWMVERSPALVLKAVQELSKNPYA